MLPSITNVINLADSHDRAAFAMATHIKQEPRERENSETKEEVRMPRNRSLRVTRTHSLRDVLTHTHKYPLSHCVFVIGEE